MLDYPALAALSAVLAEGGFDRAGARLGVTPSAISQRVRGLEERLGAVLVVRGHPPVATEAGARLRAHFEQVRLLEAEVSESLPALPLRGPGAAPPVLRVAVNADSFASWFPPAAAAFAAATGATLDLLLEDEGFTADRLRSGEVLAAVTADPAEVPGCRRARLGALRYAAVASPAFLEQHLPDGITAGALARAPMLRFDRRDHLQARWAEATFGGPWQGDPAQPVHWVPTTQGFVDMARAGAGWATNPLALVAPDLDRRALVELVPGARLDVPLYWQSARLGATLLAALTREVRAAARAALVSPA
jgi:LysR family transcriptional regulator (chromosome initiation inhibitor)